MVLKTINTLQASLINSHLCSIIMESTFAGPFTDGYQQSPSNFSISSGANSLMSSMGVPRMTSQLIPTPGFNNNNNNSQSYMNLESSSNGVGFSSVESMVSQPLQQNQHVGSQNCNFLFFISVNCSKFLYQFCYLHLFGNQDLDFILRFYSWFFILII